MLKPPQLKEQKIGKHMVHVCSDEGYGGDGAYGTKVRLLDEIKRRRGVARFVYSGSRHSPCQVFVAYAAKLAEIPAEVFVPKSAELTDETKATVALGATMHYIERGYPSVRRCAVNKYLLANDAYFFDVERPDFIYFELIAEQIKGLAVAMRAAGISRIITPAGSGTTCWALAYGVSQSGLNIEVAGVPVGSESLLRRTSDFITKNYSEVGGLARQQNFRDPTFLPPSELGYTQSADNEHGIYGRYEGKIIPYIKKGDCLWLIGKFDNDEFLLTYGGNPAWSK